MRPDTASARDVLGALCFGCDGLVELRALPAGRGKNQCFTYPNQEAGKRAFVRRHPGKDLYWGVSTRQSDANGTESNCLHLGSLFADCGLQAVD